MGRPAASYTQESLVIPADAFPSQITQARGHVVLEVRGMVKAGGRETITELLQARSPSLGALAVQGPRSFARTKVSLANEASARAMIKAIAEERGQKAAVKEVRG